MRHKPLRPVFGVHMNLSSLLQPLQVTSVYQDLLTQLRQAAKQVVDAQPPNLPTTQPPNHPTIRLNLLNAARPYVLAALQSDWGRPILALAAKPEHALQLYRQLLIYAQTPDDVLYFPEPESLPYERSAMSLDTRQKRLMVLQRVASIQYPVSSIQ